MPRYSEIISDEKWHLCRSTRPGSMITLPRIAARSPSTGTSLKIQNTTHQSSFFCLFAIYGPRKAQLAVDTVGNRGENIRSHAREGWSNSCRGVSRPLAAVSSSCRQLSSLWPTLLQHVFSFVFLPFFRAAGVAACRPLY